MNGYKFLSKLGSRTRSFLSKGLKILLYVFLAFICIVILKGMLKKDEMVIQPINTPKVFKESGFEGPYVAEKLEEHIEEIYNFATTIREESMQINVDQSKDINMNVMGLGVSASNIIYHLRDLLGIQTNYITGHITDMDHMLSLKLNISQPNRYEIFDIAYDDDNKLEVFDSLLFLGAQFITEINDPYRMAVYYHQKADNENALRIIRKLSQSKEDKKWAYNLWANIIKEQHGVKDAIQFYHYALKDDPDFDLAHRNLGFTYYGIDSIELAIQHFKSTGQTNTGSDFNVNHTMARAYTKLGKSDMAKSYYQKNLDQFPNSVFAYRNYSEFLLARGDTSDVIALFDKARSMSLEGEDYFMMMGGYHYYRNNIDSCLIYFEKATLFNPDNMDAITAIAEISNEAGRFERAVPYYKEAISKLMGQRIDNPNRLIGILNSLAISEYSSGQPDSAIVHISRAIKQAPDYGILYSTLAEAYAVKGQKEKFFQILETAFQKGFEFDEEYWEDYPYTEFKDSARLLRLIDKYKAEDTKANLSG